MTKNIVITNPRRLTRLKESISKAGIEGFYVVSDFDKTLTRSFVDGKSIPSLISILRDGNYLTPDYAEKAHALYNKYHPIEINPEVPLEEKKKAMEEWWMVHFDLLIKSGLNKNDLEKVINSGKIKFREGASDFFDFLYAYDIPLIIISSSGLGGDAISLCLEKEKKLYGNIYIVSNFYIWDENRKAVAVKEPIVHVMNKNEIIIQNFPFFDKIKDRKNILLLGDSPESADMVKGFDYDKLIKIGFLDENIQESLKYYKKVYDAVLLNDAPMHYVNDLLDEIIK